MAAHRKPESVISGSSAVNSRMATAPVSTLAGNVHDLKSG